MFLYILKYIEKGWQLPAVTPQKVKKNKKPGDYIESDDYRKRIVLKDKGEQRKYIGNNTIAVYEYISLITPSSNTNFVFLKNTTQTLNQTLTKEALNKTAFVGDIVKRLV